MPGAFAKSIKYRKPAMLWQHRSDMPIGVWDLIEERGKGLFLKGPTLDTTSGIDAYKAAKAGAVTGLSIGFTTKRYEMDEKTNVRKLLEVELYEVSLVTFPANEKATVTRVKSADGSLKTEREIEEYLRDGGLSWREAKAFVAGGYKAIAGHRDGEGQELQQELAELLGRFATNHTQ